MTIRVYIAGPLFGSGRSTENVHAAVMAAERVRAFGAIPFVPHLYSLWDTISPKPESFWLQMDQAWLAQCDAMLRLPGESPGSDKEEAWCKEFGIPVFHEFERLYDWMVEDS